MTFKLIVILSIIFISSILLAQEAGKYELSSIGFEGNEKLSSSLLFTVIESKESPGWFWKFLDSFTPFGSSAVYLDTANLSIDLRAISSFYLVNGFFETSVSYVYSIDSVDSTADVRFLIKEGQPALFGKLNLFGLEQVPDPILYPFWDEIVVDTTKRYSQENVQQKISNSIVHLLNSGYKNAVFDSSIIHKDTLRNRADLDLYFSPGLRFVIDTVIVNLTGEGQAEVSEELLREVAGIKSNEFYSLEKLKLSQSRLFRTGLFNSFTFTSLDEKEIGDRVPLRLDGSIGKMNELSPEIIMNNQQSAFNIGLGASYIRKNFLGRARKLTLSTTFGVQDIFNIDYGNLIQGFSFRDTTLLGYLDSRFSIDQPFLFGKPIFGKLEFYATINKQATFNNTIYGSKLIFEFELPHYTFINFLNTSYNVEISNETYRTLNLTFANRLISAIGTEFGGSHTDDILFPTDGYNLSIQLEEANSIPYILKKISGSVFDGALFYKIVANTSFYFSLNQKRTTIFAVKEKIGYLQTFFGDYLDIPLNRTFYTGGSNSVRGWRANQLVPRGTPLILLPSINGVNVKGGTFLLEGSAELRFKLLESIGAAVFFDYGNTWLGYKQFRFDDVALATGFGFRYYTSIAPFRLDFGFKLYDPADKNFIFQKNYWDNLEIHFGIGEAF